MRYLEVHKLLYAVLIESRKLRHNFHAHKISVVTSYPLKVVLHSPNVTGNIAKWAAELDEFEMHFIPHHMVKSQVLADFVADWTLLSCAPGGRALVNRRSKLWSSPSPTGLSSSMAPRTSKVSERGFCSRLYVGSSSSIWCTLTSRQPIT
jgi:hypothetical protein